MLAITHANDTKFLQILAYKHSPYTVPMSTRRLFMSEYNPILDPRKIPVEPEMVWLKYLNSNFNALKVDVNTCDQVQKYVEGSRELNRNNEMRTLIERQLIKKS